MAVTLARRKSGDSGTGPAPAERCSSHFAWQSIANCHLVAGKKKQPSANQPAALSVGFAADNVAAADRRREVPVALQAAGHFVVGD